MIKSCFIFALLLGVIAPVQSVLPGRACVVDESRREPALQTYLDKLRGAVRGRDLASVLLLVSPNIQVEPHGVGQQSVARFVKLMDLGQSTGAGWERLDALLQLGGKFTRPDVFCVPYFMCPTWPGRGTDTVVVVLDREVPGRRAPSPESAVVQTFSCEVLRVGGEGLVRPALDAPGWIVVAVNANRWAYVQRSAVALADEYLLISFENGQWRLSAVGGTD